MSDREVGEALCVQAVDQHHLEVASGTLEKVSGFISHLSGPDKTGYRVIEVWDSVASHQAWYEGSVLPNLPLGVEPTAPEYIGLTMEAGAVAPA